MLEELRDALIKLEAAEKAVRKAYKLSSKTNIETDLEIVDDRIRDARRKASDTLHYLEIQALEKFKGGSK